jgi:hypothetical protein
MDIQDATAVISPDALTERPPERLRTHRGDAEPA